MLTKILVGFAALSVRFWRNKWTPGKTELTEVG